MPKTKQQLEPMSKTEVEEFLDQAIEDFEFRMKKSGNKSPKTLRHEAYTYRLWKSLRYHVNGQF